MSRVRCAAAGARTKAWKGRDMNGLPRTIAPLLIAGALLSACASLPDVRATGTTGAGAAASATSDTTVPAAAAVATPLAQQTAPQASALVAGGVLQLQVGGNAGVPAD